MTENIKKPKWWHVGKFLRMIVLGFFSLVSAVMITQSFSFETGWQINFKDFKEIATAIVTAPVLLLVWWLRVVHHEETLAAQQKTNEIAETIAKTAQIVANNEKEFKIYERRYAELNDIKASLEVLKPLIFDEQTAQLKNPNEHKIQNVAIFALVRLTDFLQEGEDHLQPIRRAAFILLKQTWASYVCESYEQREQFYKLCLENDLVKTENRVLDKKSVNYRSDSMIQQLTKTLLRGLKRKDKGSFILTDDRKFKAELSQPIFKDELSDLWLIGINTELVPDVCFYAHKIDFEKSNFSFSILQNINFEEVGFIKVICEDTHFSSGKINFVGRSEIEYSGNISFLDMKLDGASLLSFYNQENIFSRIDLRLSLIKKINIDFCAEISIFCCNFYNASLILNTQFFKICNLNFIHVKPVGGSLPSLRVHCDTNDLTVEQISNINYILNFNASNIDDFLTWRNNLPKINEQHVYQFENEQDQNYIFEMTDALHVAAINHKITQYIKDNKLKKLTKKTHTKTSCFV